MVSKSNRCWLIAHKNELHDLPDGEFLYEEVDLNYSIFTQAVERELLEEVDETENNKKVWRVKDNVRQILSDEIK